MRKFPFACVPVALSSLVGLAACASVNARLPDISADRLSEEQAYQESVAFQEMQTLRTRYIPVASRVLQANAPLCKETRADIGVLTERLDDYPKDLRDGAKRDLNLSDDPQISFIVPGSAADVAGLEIGDRLVDPDGGYFEYYDDDLTALLAKAGQLDVTRDEQTFTVQIDAVASCDYKLKLEMSSEINALATGKSIEMSAGMIRFVESDAELAYIIGHELAHNTENHIFKAITNYILSGFATRYTRPFEAEADYVGLYYAARANYDLDGVQTFWRRLARTSMRSIARAKTHPTYPSRYLQIADTVQEIRAKEDAGRPLIPNRKDDETRS